MSTPFEIAQQHLAAGRLVSAAEALRRVLARSPDDAAANGAVGAICFMQQREEQAEYHFKRALAGDPNSPETLQNYANLLLKRGQTLEAITYFERSITVRPQHPAAWSGLCAAHGTLGHLSLAAEYARKSLQLGADHDVVYGNAANAFMEAGLVSDSLATLRRGAQHFPGATTLRSMYLASLHYPHDPACLSARAIYDEHARLGVLYATKTKPFAPAVGATEAQRPLRIAFLSSDLRGHSVASFLLPFLRNRDRAAFRVSAYFHGADDAMTGVLRTLADAWTNVRTLNDEALAQRIRRDRIDILIDLNGHTVGNRLAVLALKPAPIQATYLGYPNTTGIAGVDFRIVDAMTDPPTPGSPDLATETLVRLPRCFLCYEPPGDAPPVNVRNTNEPITFTSFNALFKASDLAIELWARVLLAVPGSRLLIKNKGMGDPAVAVRYRTLLAARGVDSSRFEALGHQQSIPDHLRQYQRVDIALDTYPYHGTTTTCEALHMGVPVVTLAGESHVSRVGVSLLAGVGLDDLVAKDSDEFVRLAAGLARDRTRLAELRRTLRARFLASEVCDGPAFARSFEAALQTMWRGARLSSER